MKNELKIIENNDIVAELKQELVLLEQQSKVLADQQSKVREAIKEAMEENNIDKIENDQFVITYFPENEVASLNQEKLKDEFQEVFIECMEIKKKKSFIKIKLK